MGAHTRIIAPQDDWYAHHLLAMQSSHMWVKEGTD